MIRRFLLLAGLLLSGAASAQTYTRPAYPVLMAHSAGPVTCPANTGEQNLAVFAVPPNYLGAGGQVRVSTGWTNNNNANSKTMSIRFATTSAALTGGMVASTVANTTNTTQTMIFFLNNTTTTSQQTTNIIGSVGAAASTQAAGSVDTTGATYVNINCNLAVNTDTLTLVWWTVEAFKSGVTYNGN